MSALARRTATAAALSAVAALLTGCSDERAVPPPTEARPGVGEVTVADDGVQEITVQTQDDYVFVPPSFTVDPGRVRLTLINVGEQMVHNLRFTPGEGPEAIEAQIDLLEAGAEETIEFEVAEPGDHRYECTFHERVGQIGTMTVTG